MIRSITIFISVAVLSLWGSIVLAQQPHHPQIIVGHQGIKPLKLDLEYLLKMTSNTDQAQLANLVDFIDLLAFGLDEERPIRVDILSGTSPSTFLIWAPFHSFPDLDENLQSNFTIKKSQEDLFEVLPPDSGWFRSIPAIKYALLILTNPADHLLLKQLILKANNPLNAIQALLEGGSNLGVRLINDAQTKEDQTKRTSSFSEIRAVRMDALQKRPTESPTEFAIRQGFVSTQLDEIERLLVEASAADAKFIVDRGNNSAKIVFNAEAIAGTSFAESVGLFGRQDDAFTGVGKPEGSVLSVRVNHPIDSLRERNANKILDLMVADSDARLKASTDLSAAEKAASTKLLEGVVKVARDGIGTGYINGFVETVPDEAGELMTYGAVSVIDGLRLNDILPLIADSGKGNQIDTAIETIGDITIHRIRFAKGYLSLLDRILGVEQDSYVGVSDSIVWFGTGSGVLEPLKAAISSKIEPQESDVILKAEANLLPWARQIKTLIEELPQPTSVDDKQVRRDNLVRLAQAIEAFASLDEVRFDMSVKDGKSSGEIYLNSGFLKFIGMQIATFSRNTLE